MKIVLDIVFKYFEKNEDVKYYVGRLLIGVNVKVLMEVVKYF